jgi:DNA-binding NtrC family response regulator
MNTTPPQQFIEIGKSLEDAMNELTRQYILASLQRNSFDKEKTAQELKISLPTLYRRIKELNITQ